MSTYSDPALILPNAVETDMIQDGAVTAAKLNVPTLAVNADGVQYQDSDGAIVFQGFTSPASRSSGTGHNTWMDAWSKTVSATPDNKIHLKYEGSTPGGGSYFDVRWKKNGVVIGTTLNFPNSGAFTKQSDQIFDCVAGDVFTLEIFARNDGTVRTLTITYINVLCTPRNDAILS